MGASKRGHTKPRRKETIADQWAKADRLPLNVDRTLAPCPFCGEAPRYSTYAERVLCPGCGARGPMSKDVGLVKAVRLWNSWLND